MRRGRAALGVLASAALVALSPGGRPPRARPNLLLITVESLRADALGCYAGGGTATPAINALAARGIRFEKAYAASPSTAPSAATILTGLYPIHHGLRHDLESWLSRSVPTLATVLGKAGYRTSAVLGSFHLDSDRGLDRGFDLYDDDIQGLKKASLGRSRERRADEVVYLGLRILDSEEKGKPFFLWLDFYDPHYDYDPPEPYKKDPPREAYAGEVAFVDTQIGSLVQGLRTRGFQNDTEIILAATHGEGLGDHGETGHGIYLYETTIRVPLIIVPPEGTRGRVIPSAVGLVDVAPTILAAAGLPVPPKLDGRSLVPLLEGGQAAPRPCFVEAVQPHEAYGWSPLFGVINGDHKIVSGRRLEAFDLGSDPSEATPITSPPTWAGGLEKFGRPLLGSLDPPPDLRHRILSQAGALDLPWRDEPICLEKQDWPDARDRVSLNDPLFRARIAHDYGLPGKAANISLQDVLPADRADFAALAMVAELALRNGDRATLTENLELMQCNYPLRATSYHLLGHDLLRQKEMGRAELAFKLCALIEPRSEEPFYDLADLYALEGKKDLAFANLEKSIVNGATDFAFIRRDPLLAPLHDDPRFTKLVGAAPSAVPNPTPGAAPSPSPAPAPSPVAAPSVPAPDRPDPAGTPSGTTR